MSTDLELLTAQALAEALGLSVETVWRYTRENKIPYIALGNRQYRYRLADVLRSLSGAQVKDEPADYRVSSNQKLTYHDYLALPEEDGCRYELLDWVLVKDPAPIVMHQRVSRRLQRMLEDYVAATDPAGEVFNAPLDVKLGDYTVVQPDILYIAGGQKELVLRERIEGSPMLVVEVLSASTASRDRVRKMRIYQQARIPHYWLVDPEERTMECLELQDGSYAIVASGMDEDVVEAPGFPGLTIELKALWS